MSYRILIVDDEPDIREVVSLLLAKDGYETVKAPDAPTAIRLLREQPNFDLIVLDIMMPGMDGVTACHTIRSFSRLPILFLTAKTSVSDKQEAYQTGGDDYLGKPFSENDLRCKVSSLIRRYRVYQTAGNDPQQRLSLEEDTRCAVKDGQIIPVTEKEYAILHFFLTHPGVPVDPRTLYETVWKEQFLPSATNTVMVHIVNLRRKLEVDPTHPTLIRTVWGRGYQLDNA